MPYPIPVFYSPKQVSRPLMPAPSPSKPPHVVAIWEAGNFPLQIEKPSAVSREQFAFAHSRDYVDAILDLKFDNGFGDREAGVAASLPWTSGSFLSAARSAIETGRVAVSPTSGFHHAGYDFGGGYCTFNGLMVAATALIQDGHASKIGILDCDQHFGNGTEDIIERLGCRSQIVHVTAGQGYSRNADTFLNQLSECMDSFHDCDLLMYQAGADQHMHDPLGGFLSTKQLFERDQFVFQFAASRGIPIVWNLAGGYQKPLAKVLAIHRNTMRACVESFAEIQVERLY